MIVLSALLIAGWAATVVVLVRSLDRARREHARREDLLVNQLCSLAGRPWLPPPASDDPGWHAPEGFSDWVDDPEQLIGA